MPTNTAAPADRCTSLVSSSADQHGPLPRGCRRGRFRLRVCQEISVASGWFFWPLAVLLARYSGTSSHFSWDFGLGALWFKESVSISRHENVGSIRLLGNDLCLYKQTNIVY